MKKLFLLLFLFTIGIQAQKSIITPSKKTQSVGDTFEMNTRLQTDSVYVSFKRLSNGTTTLNTVYALTDGVLNFTIPTEIDENHLLTITEKNTIINDYTSLDAATFNNEVNGLGNWTNASSSLISSSNEQALDGNYSIKIVNDSPNSIYNYGIINFSSLEIGATYEIKFSYYTNDGVGNAWFLNGFSSSIQVTLDQTNVWTETTTIIEATATEALIRVYPAFYGGETTSNGFSIYIDSIIMTKQ